MNGLLLVKKPSGITSHDLVAKARKLLRTREIGHAGTLDPMATGLMVLLIGEATKLSDYVLSGDKGYRLEVKLGIKTDSFDITGQVLSQVDTQLDPDRIVHEARNLVGDFEWEVPIFSAVKVGGKKLYSYAHKSQEASVIPKKVMKFWDFTANEVTGNSISGEIYCSKGSYIRTWASKLGDHLIVGGALSRLERIYSAPYRLENAIEIQLLENPDLQGTEEWQKAFVPMGRTLMDWPSYMVRGKDLRLILNGQISHDLERRMIVEMKSAIGLGQTIRIKLQNADTGDLLALIEAIPERGFKIKRVFRPK